MQQQMVLEECVMKINVWMLAFEEEEKVRVVEIPDHNVLPDIDTILGLVFQYGQNAFCPQPICSVSVGDVIDLVEHGLWVVMPVGFRKVSQEWLDDYRKLPRLDRTMLCYRIE